MNEAAKYFGWALAAVRSERGLKRMQLKELSGLSYPYIAEIENGGKYPSQKAIQKLADALGLSPLDLMSRADALARQSGDAEMRRAEAQGSAALPPAPAASETGRVEPTPPTVGPTASTNDAGSDALVLRISDQVYRSVEPRLREWLQMEIRMAVREELDRQRGEV